MERYAYTRQYRLLSMVVLMLLSASTATSAAEVKFSPHRVGRFRAEACGVADFNNDGKPDIVAGMYWYEAPKWKTHKFRDSAAKLDPQGKTHAVDEKGKGYYDDFSNGLDEFTGDAQPTSPESPLSIDAP